MKFKDLTLGQIYDKCKNGLCKDCPFNSDVNPKVEGYMGTWLCSTANDLERDVRMKNINMEDEVYE